MSGKRFLIAALLLAWTVSTVGAFWVYAGRYLRPTPRPPGASVAHLSTPPPAALAALETNQGIVTLGHPGPITVLNFWNPDCPCSHYAEKDVARLAAAYASQGVRFITVVASGKTVREQRLALAAWHAQHQMAGDPVLADAGNHLALALGVWAAPAAVILNAQGQVAYTGAYNAARYCSATQTAWAAQALAAIVQNHRPLHSTTPFYGCQLLAAQN